MRIGKKTLLRLRRLCCGCNLIVAMGCLTLFNTFLVSQHSLDEGSYGEELVGHSMNKGESRWRELWWRVSRALAEQKWVVVVAVVVIIDIKDGQFVKKWFSLRLTELQTEGLARFKIFAVFDWTDWIKHWFLQFLWYFADESDGKIDSKIIINQWKTAQIGTAKW